MSIMSEERRVLEVVRVEFWEFNACIKCKSIRDAIVP
jgi:hypothetical protein